MDRSSVISGDGIQILDDLSSSLPQFSDKLQAAGLMPFRPTNLDIMQINVGYMCNITCEHCHVSAGPKRKEIMTRSTMQLCLDAIDVSDIKTVDLTGGAPEMNPDFIWFTEELSKRKLEIIVRSNLIILTVNKRFRTYPDFFKKHKVRVIASLPCYTEETTDKQRGNGVFAKSIEALVHLNRLGYGKEGTGLELHLVYNPGGPSLPPAQDKLEQDYKTQLLENHRVVFNSLYTITNLPVGRFLDYLEVVGRTEEYLDLLVNSFNPHAAESVMCRNTISVGWDGILYDCDFNQMLEMGLSGDAPKHIRDFKLARLENRTINTNLHCFGCTAGAGSSCQGALT
ncbi:MAG: arsenosugar biosynthesis radical SAM protein ArsS [Flavobacteriales bacterium]|nr:arsenosugar biosynthesis radical SAM protein ArsS [Flavobacteriales bacterium]